MPTKGPNWSVKDGDGGNPPDLKPFKNKHPKWGVFPPTA